MSDALPQEEELPEESDAFAEPTDETRLKSLEEEIARLKDAYLRAMAETENVRARAKRESEDTAKYAVSRFARDMVNIPENLKRASDSIPPDARAQNEMLKTIGDGIDMTLQEILSIFERNGLRRIDPKGERFDHNLHQAVAQVPRADVEPGTVLDVLQAGYLLHDRLLKPAMVTVATAPAEGA